ncbi:low molecular weight protein-tyrosine-phosphatase [Rhizobium sp. 18065]|uniref:low molecular weight protein-tyrosine-phosphatase n=1 Tax=Rhizobium sp. 18065 TaxID=2681411 RepID=UPI00135C7816|nr:low molecular weight protein-tyrosine-phosphatase [Rhizobium sp. 18065]
MNTPSILFVCLGNICRSPLAEGIYRHVVASDVYSGEIASAGIGGWHVGNPPDHRSILTARRHGIDISSQKARQVKPQDFATFDLILAMDASNLERLRALAPAEHRDRLHLFSRYATSTSVDVPDPYYGGQADFDAVYTMLFSGCKALVAKFATERFS